MISVLIYEEDFAIDVCYDFTAVINYTKDQAIQTKLHMLTFLSRFNAENIITISFKTNQL